MSIVSRLLGLTGLVSKEPRKAELKVFRPEVEEISIPKGVKSVDDLINEIREKAEKTHSLRYPTIHSLLGLKEKGFRHELEIAKALLEDDSLKIFLSLYIPKYIDNGPQWSEVSKPINQAMDECKRRFDERDAQINRPAEETLEIVKLRDQLGVAGQYRKSA